MEQRLGEMARWLMDVARGMVLPVAGMAGLPVQMLMGLRRPPQTDAADALAVAITHAQRGTIL